MKRSTKFVAAAVAALVAASAAQAEVTIGYLGALTGAQADMTGEAALHATRMAIADFGGEVNGEPIEVLVADHAGKPDLGLATAREWVDAEGVNLILNVDNSAVALAVSDLIKDKNVTMAMGASSSRLINESCGPHQIMLLLDNGTLARAVTLPQLEAGAKDWYFITVDYALGHDLEAQATKAIEANGGTVKGSVVHSPQATDFSSFLLQAQSSGATNIALATFGAWQNAIAKQAQEFGVQQSLSPFYLADTDIKSAGLDTLQNVTGTIQFYWDENDATRAFSDRFREDFGRPPTFTNAYHYEFTTHYLKAIEATGGTDADAIQAWMRDNPMALINGDTATIREDGAVVRDVLSYRTKTLAESTGDWDFLEITGKVDGESIAQPLADSACPLVASN
ncbi:ABC transporter substrate-binding protein [Mesobacterium pallidum]|uniref:ABC transporter substrate-binding protein n=1 Tax=Mesobacterium pallidum TaxID=2872037 RepID=UPI001EE254C7|nr:ABC transporter substrate-binding protein [Mesobacterium pallidum]